MAQTIHKVAPLDKNGNVVNDPLGRYKSSDRDTANDPQYWGYVAYDGSWYIMKDNVSAETSRYQTGDSGYPAAWAARNSITYDYYYERMF